MIAKEIHAELAKLDRTPSKIAKVERLKTLLKDEAFGLIVHLAYSPRFVYGIGEKTLKGLRGWGLASKGPARRGFGSVDVDLIKDIAARKITGHAMINAIKDTLLQLDEPGGELMLNILKKDLRAGFNVGYINEASPGFIEVTPYMRCALPTKSRPDKWDWSRPHYVQIKADGMFANVVVKQTEKGVSAEIRSRQGQVFPEAPFANLLFAATRTFDIDTVTHGEILVWCSDTASYLPREVGNGILNSMSNGELCPKTYQPRFLAWDQVPLANWVENGKDLTEYDERFETLAQQLAKIKGHGWSGHIDLIETLPVSSLKEAKAEFKRRLLEGEEGVVLKHREGPWSDSTSPFQVKFKLEFEVELRVKGFSEGNGKNADLFGALECESECGQLQTNVPGIKDDLRKEINENRDDWMDAIITVKANGVLYGDDAPTTHHGPAASLYLPAFKGRRTDRTTADDLDRILEIRDSVIEAM